MTAWHQFLLVAGAHFLALLSPGPDFFLILRTSLRYGAGIHAIAMCAGIASANAIYIILAIAGVSLLGLHGWLFALLKWAGCFYLGWLGWQFIKAPGLTARATCLDGERAAPPPAWHGFSAGFLSAILNPKNSLFYASLFSLLIERHTGYGLRTAYGVWMTVVVLIWDLAVFSAASHPRLLGRFMRQVPWIERLSGVLLLALAGGVAWSAIQS